MTSLENILQQTLQQLKPKVDKHLEQIFIKTRAKYPPEKISLIIYKLEKTVELWALKEKLWKKIIEYPMTGFSGMLGPKLQEGDCQIPEGVYEMESLNPQSNFYLSIRINYPNSFDLERAQEDGRTHSGNDIYIHGKDQTAGCIPVGDAAIEEMLQMVVSQTKAKLPMNIDPRTRADSGYSHRCLPGSRRAQRLDWQPRLFQPAEEPGR